MHGTPSAQFRPQDPMFESICPSAQLFDAMPAEAHLGRGVHVK